ncbi:MAG TPA: flagellar assembly protein FliW [Epulopiscium sp.]|nr:flagellar assembly protein FliW [Candidatus Epulonipiscium sp.]
MKITTSNFGELQILDENIITFEKGILGFKDNTKYVIINDDEEDSPFCWLQSIEEPSLAFAMVNPFLVHENYSPKLSNNQIETLGAIDSQKDYSILAIMTIPDDVEKMSANLMAPVVINIKTKKAIQIIVEGDQYPVKYYLFEQIKKRQIK